MTERIVLLDASALYPALLCDTLLRIAEARLYHPRWSAQILDELERNLALRIGAQRAWLRIGMMRQAFPEAEVSGYDHLIAALSNHPKDRHVLAAAVVAEAKTIVTSNFRHFPSEALAPFDLVALSPDGFLAGMFDLNTALMTSVVVNQAAAYTRPPMTTAELVNRLELHVPVLAGRLRDQRL